MCDAGGYESTVPAGRLLRRKGNGNNGCSVYIPKSVHGTSECTDLMCVAAEVLSSGIQKGKTVSQVYGDLRYMPICSEYRQRILGYENNDPALWQYMVYGFYCGRSPVALCNQKKESV